ncbi:zinc-dependent metalloprotease [Pseudopedobacter beijingensis]|uniref:Zinc-dependent metalloprotease n=1 Tax=Pseudopedobacter beijingensis TaxID=1207056 RepID=A0ABW4ID46_9SPHI
MNVSCRRLISYSLVTVLAFSLFSCKAKKKKAEAQKKQQAQAIVIPPSPKPKSGAIKSFTEVITAKAKKDQGLFDVYSLDDKYYYDIPDSLLGREMLSVTRYAKVPTKEGTYGGEAVNTQVWVWEKMGKKILLKVPSYVNVADKDSDMYESVKNSNLSPILASFDIKSYGKDSTSWVIDVTDFFGKDVAALGLPQSEKTSYKVQRLDESRSYIDTVKSFPINIEVRTSKTYFASAPPGDASLGSVTIEFNTSMLLLPKEPMKPRLYDARVGFFSQGQTDYGLDAQKATTTRYVRRWRLEPKDPEAYKRGELVEPKKQIIFYIDPATPKKWRPYLIQGVKDWNIAFEAAGFKNAITCLEAPADDPNWSAEDARYSVIRYFASRIPNAYGPHVADPRSGEIVESHIGWYHNVMNLLRNWFLVQTAAVNPDARATKFKDEVMGELIRFVSSHEVGHTLGLAHNFGSSYAYPVDSLRSASFTHKMGGTAPSIMDYARFNYIAQPEDKGVLLFPGIGPYDKWAIKWAYTWFDEKESVNDIALKLNEWTKEKVKDPIYFYGKQTRTFIDPRSQSEDLGDDAVKASTYGIANLKRILPNIEKWTYEEAQPYDNLSEVYQEVITQFSRYMGHVRASVGGIYETPKTYDQPGKTFEYVEREKQKRSLQFINEQAFKTPLWLIDNQQAGKIGYAEISDALKTAQANVLSGLLEAGRLARILDNTTNNANRAYRIDEYFNDLRTGVWTELSAGGNMDTYRRSLQRVYINRLEQLLKMVPAAASTRVDVYTSDVRPLAREELKLLQTKIKAAVPRYSDQVVKAHLNDALARIDLILNPR